MNLVRRISSNTFWVALARLLGKGSSFIMVLLLARFLGVEGLGSFAFVTAFLSLFAILTDSGLDMILIREASRDLKASQALLGNGILLKAALSVVLYIAAIGIGTLLGYGRSTMILVAVSGAGFFLAPLTLYSAAFFSALDLRLPSLIEIGARTLNLVVVASLLLAGAGLVPVFVAIVGAGAVEALTKSYFARRRFRPIWRLDVSRWKFLLGEAWPLALVAVPTLFVQRIDQVMLGSLRGSAELGQYSAAVKICEGCLLLPVALLGSLFPLLSRLHQEDPLAVANTTRAAFRHLSLLGMGVACLLLQTSDALVSVTFGPAFAASASPLRVLAGALPFLYGGLVLGALFVVAGRQRGLSLVLSGAAALNVLLNGLWIPRWGATGAALATLASYGLAVLGMAIHPGSGGQGGVFLGSLWRPAIAGAVAVLGARWGGGGGTWGSPLGFAVLYPILLLATGALRREDLAVIRSLLGRGSGTEPDGPR